jgi:hypothetical protein
MQINGTTITTIQCGSKAITQAWRDGDLVWSSGPVVTYQVDNVSLYYNTGTKLKPDGSNYAYAVCRLRIYEGGVLKETKPTWKMDISINNITSTMRPYFKVSNNEIRFNVDDYGTTDLASIFGEDFTIAITPSAYGKTGGTIYVNTESNAIVSTAITSYTCEAQLNVDYLNYNQNSFVVTNKNRGVVRTTFTSGHFINVEQGLPGYFFYIHDETGLSELMATLDYGASTTISAWEYNDYSYPKILRYRMSYRNGTTGHDDFVYLLQKCQNNQTGLQIYYGVNKVNGWDIETSTYFYLANNAHTSDTTYTWKVSDHTINVYEENGVFEIYADSSTYGDVEIADNKGNYCSFTINMYVENEYNE